MQQRGPGANRKYPGNNITENVDDKEKEAQRHKEGRERFKNKVQEKKQVKLWIRYQMFLV